MDIDKFQNFKPQDDAPEKQEKIKIEWAAETLPSEKHPELNEDSILIDEEHKTFGVFDGVGGGPAGDIASKTARDSVLAHLNEVPDGADISAAKQTLLEIIVRADTAVYESSKTSIEYQYMSTTAVVVKIYTDNERKNYALVANVGDSRAYKISKDGTLRQITVDDDILSEYISDKKERLKIAQKIANIKTEKDLDKNSKIRDFFRMRNYITKSLGTKRSGEIDIDAFPIEQGDRFLITSDGIHDNLTTDEIQEIV